MKTGFVFLLLAIALGSPDWQQVDVDPGLNALEVDETDWVYPWHVIKHEDYFENTFGNPITEKDTAHLIQNSHCEVVRISDDNHYSDRLPFADGSWKGDTLVISIFQESASSNQEIELTIVKDVFHAAYYLEYTLPVKFWKVEIQEKSLSLNQLPQRGAPIKGRVDIMANEFIQWGEDNDFRMDTITNRISGTFVID